MMDNIQIIEKPDWISWDDIHNLLWKAHAENRRNGVVMRYPSLPGEEIRNRIDGKGKMLVSICDGKLVGTAALIIKEKKLWCGKGRYGYCCFASVDSTFQGNGIYKEMCAIREQMARNMNISKMMMDTNEKNQKELSIAKKAGYKMVDLAFWNDHFNVICVKWLDVCPYSNARFAFEFLLRKIIRKTLSIMTK